MPEKPDAIELLLERAAKLNRIVEILLTAILTAVVLGGGWLFNRVEINTQRISTLEGFMISETEPELDSQIEKQK